MKGNCTSDLGVEATLPQPYGSTAIMQSSFLKRVSLVDGVFIFQCYCGREWSYGSECSVC